MPVLSPERETVSSWRDVPPPPVYRRRRGVLGGAFRGLAVIVAVLLGWTGLQHVGDLLPDWGNPFRTEEVDRTGPAVLKALADLHEYRAATGSYQVMIDVEQDAKYFPSFLKGQRTLFLAQGSVDAAEPKLRAAANESALIAKAEENTTGMLTRLLGALGIDQVSVTYLDNPE